MKKLIIIGIVAVVIIAAGGVLAKTLLFKPKGDMSENGESQETETAVVERGDISEVITASGTIKPLRIVEVSSKASGEIIKMPVDEGDYLQKDQVIAEIEKTYAQNDLDQAQSDLASAKARLEQAEINRELEKKQRVLNLTQAEGNLKEANTRLAQLEEQLILAKESNVRKLKEAENNLKIAQLQLKMLSPEVVRKEEVKRSESSVTQAKSTLDLSKKEFERQKSLHEKGYISKSELDTAQKQLETANAQYESALQQLEMVKNPSTEEQIELSEANVKKAGFSLQAALENIKAEENSQKDIEIQKSKIARLESELESARENLEKQILVREKDILTAQASVNRSEFQLESANEKLDDTLVTAPISGTILTKNVEEGQVMTSRMSATSSGEGTALVTMADLTKIYVKTDVDESDIGKVQPGQSVTIEVDAFPNQVFDGRVLKISPQGKVTQNVTTFQVTTEIMGAIDRLKPGMNAEVEILAASAQDALIVPNEAILNFGGRKMVRVEGEERPRRVETGASNWEKTAIISGLEEGEVVLVGGGFGPPGGGDSRFDRFRERMKRDPTSGVRMMQRSGPGGRGRR